MELFKLFGTIEINNSKANKALDETVGKGSQTQKALSGAFSKVGSAAVTVGKTVATGIAAAGTAVGGLVAKSVQAYADYEQLVGGVDTLFKGSSAKVQEYAANAFKTAGMSANAYMETVTSFSASLLQSLGGDTEAAADKANLAITDMSDNANKMGTSMEMIQNAYQGFAKQNYTMLDNLKLGYGGTQEEMQRLLEDATALSGIKYDISSYADIVDAIHVIQTEIGITGTTAKEAEGTISGSIAMTKSAWENLMVGLATNNANIPQLVNNVVSSGAQVIKNIIPVVQQVLKSIPAAISEISPEAGAAFQGVIDICTAALPILIDAIKTALGFVVDAFNFVQQHAGALTAVAAAVSVVVAALGMYNAVAAIKAAMAAAEVTTVWGLVSAYAAQAVAMAAALAPYIAIAAAIAAVIAVVVLLVKNWDTVKAKAAEVWAAIQAAWGQCATWFNSNVVQPVVSFFSGLWEAVKTGASAAWGGIMSFFAAVPGWFSANVIQPVLSFFTGLWNGMKAIWDTICNVVQVGIMLIAGIISAAFQIITLPYRLIWENCKDIVISAWEGIKGIVSSAITAVQATITAVWNAVKIVFTTVWNAIKSVVGSVWDWISSKVSTAANAVWGVISSAWNTISTVTSAVWNAIKAVVSGVWESIKAKISAVASSVKSAISSAWNGVKSATTSAFNSVKSSVSSAWNSIKTAVSNAVNNVKSKVSGAWNSVKSATSSAFNSIKSTATSVWNGIKNGISSAINGAKDKVKSAIDKMKGFFNFSWSLPKIKLPHFKISGSFSLDPPSVPDFSISWYKKAMRNAMVLTQPTIFGYSAASGQMLGGGEAGNEVIAGEGHLMDMIGTAVAKQNESIAIYLKKLLEILADYFPQIMESMDRNIVLDSGVLVAELASPMDAALGKLQARKGRGR